jgi:hypothetical protein
MPRSLCGQMFHLLTVAFLFFSFARAFSSSPPAHVGRAANILQFILLFLFLLSVWLIFFAIV